MARYRNPNWAILQVGLGVIASIICFICLCIVIYVYKTYQVRGKNSLSLSLKLLNLFGVLSFLFAAISQSVNEYYWNVYYWQESTSQTASWLSMQFFWSFGEFMSYLLFLDRIKITFKNSAFEPSKWIILFLYSLSIMFEMCWIMKTIIPIIFWTQYMDNTAFTQNVSYQIEIYLTIPTMIIAATIILSMSYIFVSRLLKMILLQTRMRYQSFDGHHKDSYIMNDKTSNTNSSPLTEELILTNKNIQIIRICVKMATLSISSLLSSFVFASFDCAAYYHNFDGPTDKIRMIWLQIDMVISCICLILFLPKTQKAYDILCCCCRSICSKYVQNKVVQISMNSD